MSLLFLSFSISYESVCVCPKHTWHLAFQIRQLIEHHSKKFSSKCHDRIHVVSDNNKDDPNNSDNDNNNIIDDVLAVPRHLGVVDGEPVLGCGPPT